MATQGPNGGTGAGAGWTGPTNIATTNAVYATQTIGAASTSTQLSTSTMGFSIPAGSTINGITVAIVRHASATLSLDFNTAPAGVSLTKVAGTPTGTQKQQAGTWGTTDATQTFGSGADLWGTTWTPADVNSTGFGVALVVENIDGVNNRIASIDSVLVTVTFTPPPPTSGNMLLVF